MRHRTLLTYALAGALAELREAKTAQRPDDGYIELTQMRVDEIKQMLSECEQRESDWFNCSDFGVTKRFYNGKIQIVMIDEYPDTDKYECYEITDLAHDLSQGTGNVISRYFYVPAIDILLNYVDE